MFRVVMCCWNAGKYVQRSIASLLHQECRGWHAYLVDDMSTDDTMDIAEAAIHGDPRFTIIRNKEKFWGSGNHYQVIHRPEIDPHDVCVDLDADDWLADEGVFNRLERLYSSRSELWATWGSFRIYHGPESVVDGWAGPIDRIEDMREMFEWRTTHLRTYRAGLFRKVPRANLVGPDGLWIGPAYDLAFMIPMYEMAGLDRVQWVPDINYIYNQQTAHNDFKEHASEQSFNATYLRKRPRFQRIESYV